MQCFPGSVRVFVGLLALSACARPTLESEGVDRGSENDAALPELDAAEPRGTVDPAPVDAGRPPPRVDAAASASDAMACDDSDRDGVCDDADNCPAAANPEQDDADRNGKGDACEPEAGAPPAACGATAVAGSVMAGDAELTNVRVNGMASPVSVRKGQRLSVSIGFAFGECSLPIPGQPRFMLLGLEGRSNGDCQILVEVPCPTPVMSNVTLMLDAPATAGPAYVVALGRQGFACSDSLNGAKRIAALCVE